VIDAALATCASQPEFLPISYGAWYERQEYIGAGLGANNPVRHVIAEARSYFTREPSVSVLLSLGSGHPGILALDPDDKSNGLYRLMHEMMRDSEQEAQDIEQQMAQVRNYFRFSVEQGMQRIDDRAKALDWITAQTKSYLELPKIVTKIAEFIGNLSLGVRVTTLTQLGTFSSQSIAHLYQISYQYANLSLRRGANHWHAQEIRSAGGIGPWGRGDESARN
jgi:hypothetical protein